MMCLSMLWRAAASPWGEGRELSRVVHLNRNTIDQYVGLLICVYNEEKKKDVKLYLAAADTPNMLKVTSSK